jgi:hypothetical protein
MQIFLKIKISLYVTNETDIKEVNKKQVAIETCHLWSENCGENNCLRETSPCGTYKGIVVIKRKNWKDVAHN